jgi:hypothetical protein
MSDEPTKFIVRFLDGSSMIVSELNCARACVLAAWLRMQEGASTHKELHVFSASLMEVPK